MGSRNTAGVTGKDKEIELLKSKLEAYEILTSQLKNRLLYTQDALQSTHSSHLQELALEKEANERLQLRYDRSKQILRTLRKEKDDLKEAFDVLLQKVEVCNNYASWPFPRIHMAVPASSLDPIEEQRPQHNIDHEAAYSSAMMIKLTRERDEARTERDFVIKESVAKLSMLEAQLALRDAEIEGLSASQRPRLQEGEVPISRLSGEDALRIFRYNAAKNTTVQKEVKRLQKRLETPPEGSAPRVVDEFNRELEDLASKLEALRLEKEKLLDFISANKEQVQAPPPSDVPAEPTPTREELQAAYKEVVQRADTLARENERLRLLLNAKDKRDKETQTQTNDDKASYDDDDDGERSMEIATPLFPSTLVLRSLSSSRRSSARTSPRSPQPSPDLEVDPSSIMLPPSPLIDIDSEDDDIHLHPQPGPQAQSTPLAFLSPQSHMDLDWDRGPTPSPDRTFRLSSLSPIPGPTLRPSPLPSTHSPGGEVYRLEEELAEAQKKLLEGEEAVDELKALIEDLVRLRTPSPS
ncbi:hypothetical protein Moror_2723 [Moniliophthora roreri MCA 2997]|uniref:Uncharacterized protein n=2 Tax=Moniliophthora roreri TaxID=221103 RepID=V2XEW1_MONRO|nr:hypothetical protein Moror_2723 [Moniliophthora roreri MCA 2997]KAI3603448.1 hypothetical protein WG66_014279 [Moniliophthora roreri]